MTAVHPMLGLPCRPNISDAISTLAKREINGMRWLSLSFSICAAVVNTVSSIYTFCSSPPLYSNNFFSVMFATTIWLNLILVASGTLFVLLCSVPLAIPTLPSRPSRLFVWTLVRRITSIEKGIRVMKLTTLMLLRLIYYPSTCMSIWRHLGMSIGWDLGTVHKFQLAQFFWLGVMIGVGVFALILRIQQLSSVATIPITAWHFSEWLLLSQFVANLASLIDYDVDIETFSKYISQSYDLSDCMVEAKDVMTQILAAAMAQTLRDRSIVVGLVLQLTLSVDDLMKAFPLREPPKRRRSLQ